MTSINKILLVVIISISFFVSACGDDSDLILTAQEDLYVYNSKEEAWQLEEGEGTLFKQGHQFLVLTCHDNKSDFTIEVEIDSETIGFIRSGSWDFNKYPDCL